MYGPQELLESSLRALMKAIRPSLHLDQPTNRRVGSWTNDYTKGLAGRHSDGIFTPMKLTSWVCIYRCFWFGTRAETRA